MSADTAAAGALRRDSASLGVSRYLLPLNIPKTNKDLQKENTTSNDPSISRLMPPRFNPHRKFQVTKGFGKQPALDTGANIAAGAGPSKTPRPVSNPFEDSYASSVENDSYQPSNTISSGSSFTHPIVDTPDTGYLSTQEHEFFKDRASPEKKIRTPINPLSMNPRVLPGSSKRHSDGSSSTGGSGTDRIEPVPPPNAETRPHPQRSPLAETTLSPEVAIKQASEVQRVTVKDQKRGKRNIVIQKYMVTVGLVAIKYVTPSSPFSKFWPCLESYH